MGPNSAYLSPRDPHRGMQPARGRDLSSRWTVHVACQLSFSMGTVIYAYNTPARSSDTRSRRGRLVTGGALMDNIVRWGGDSSVVSVNTRLRSRVHNKCTAGARHTCRSTQPRWPGCISRGLQEAQVLVLDGADCEDLRSVDARTHDAQPYLRVLRDAHGLLVRDLRDVTRRVALRRATRERGVRSRVEAGVE